LPPCLRLFVDVASGPATSEAFWTRTDPYTVGNNPELTFRFSLDAELWSIADVVRVIEGDPASVPKMRDILSKWSITDLSHEALEKITLPQLSKNQIAIHLWSLANDALKAQGRAIGAKLERESGPDENKTVELVMKGSRDVPSQFKSEVDWLFATTKDPQTHFHVSVPVKAVTDAQMLAAGRALETKVLFDALLSEREFPEGDNYYPYDHTLFSLRNGLPSRTRGAVRIENRRFDDPVFAHDVEIRDWNSPEQALETAHFLMELVQQAPRLKLFPDFAAPRVPSIMPPNLNGALRYAAKILETEGTVERSTLDQLRAFADEIESGAILPPELRKRIAQFVKEKNLPAHLSLKTFVSGPDAPEPPPAPPDRFDSFLRDSNVRWQMSGMNSLRFVVRRTPMQSEGASGVDGVVISAYHDGGNNAETTIWRDARNPEQATIRVSPSNSDPQLTDFYVQEALRTAFTDLRLQTVTLNNEYDGIPWRYLQEVGFRPAPGRAYGTYVIERADWRAWSPGSEDDVY